MAENPPRAKRKRRTFVDNWLTDPEFQPWLERVNGDENLAWCSTCSKSVKAEISTIKRHGVNNFTRLNIFLNHFIIISFC